MNMPVDIQNTQPARGMAAAHSDSNKAIAEVHAAMVIAQSHPRNEIRAIDKIQNAFTRPSLAEVAQYQFSKGGTDVCGPSIRSAEAIAQLWGNIQFGFRELSRGVDERGITYSEVEAYAWDIENNTKRPTTFIVKHWRDTKSGGYQLKEERDIYELTANMAQRRVRACILAVIPGDVFEVAMRQAAVTLKSSADTSPEAMKKMLDAFSDYGVTKEQIEDRIQRHLDSIQPAQVVSLKRIYASLRDGMSEAADWFGGKAGNGSGSHTPSELPPYPDEKFKVEIDKWAKLVAEGKKTPKDIINMISSKHTLTDTQVAAILDLSK